VRARAAARPAARARIIAAGTDAARAVASPLGRRVRVVRLRDVFSALPWLCAAALVLSATLDPARRPAVRGVLAALCALWVLRLVLRRRRLGRASAEELDVLSGADFEDYVAERVRAAGWTPSEILRRGDFGADLVAERRGVRVAVQAKRRAANVGNRAVQEALAGADFHRCDAALVVTQSGFTVAARRQAAAARRPVALAAREDLARLGRVLDELAAAVDRGRRD
jgi:HJR/Mrr/RecB family endonuclease